MTEEDTMSKLIRLGCGREREKATDGLIREVYLSACVIGHAPDAAISPRVSPKAFSQLPQTHHCDHFCELFILIKYWLRIQ